MHQSIVIHVCGLKLSPQLIKPPDTLHIQEVMNISRDFEELNSGAFKLCELGGFSSKEIPSCPFALFDASGKARQFAQQPRSRVKFLDGVSEGIGNPLQALFKRNVFV